jgi:acetyl-CoA C-acetyltransferase
LLEAAALYAKANGISRIQQNAYAAQSHQRAVAAAALMRDELVDVLGDSAVALLDAYPRNITPERAARMSVVAGGTQTGLDCAVSALAISAKADGAAFVLLATD